MRTVQDLGCSETANSMGPRVACAGEIGNVDEMDWKCEDGFDMTSVASGLLYCLRPFHLLIPRS